MGAPAKQPTAVYEDGERQRRADVATDRKAGGNAKIKIEQSLSDAALA